MRTLRRSPLFRFLAAWALGGLLFFTVAPGVALGAPLVAITRPVQGAVVSGQIWIDVAFSATSNVPVTRLEVYIDDQLAREVDLAQPLLMGRQSFNWDFTYASNTTHKIGARAIDASGQAAFAAITVQVQNATASGPDVIAPVVRIYYPAQGAKVYGVTEIKAEATDNVGVEVVYFYIDGRLHKMTMNAPPYVDAWDTTREADGLHVLEAVAVDKAGNEGRSAQVTVIVENRSATQMATAAGQGMLPQGIGAATLPSTPPTPSTPAGAAPAEPSPQSAVAQAPKVVNVVPWAQTPTETPPAPASEVLPAPASGPVAIEAREPQPHSSVSPAAKTVGVSGATTGAGVLPQPQLATTRPHPATPSGIAPKSAAPLDKPFELSVPSVTPAGQPQTAAVPATEQAPGPVPVLPGPRTTATLLPLTAPVRVGLQPLARPAAASPTIAVAPGSRVAPEFAKAAAPAGSLVVPWPKRLTTPAVRRTESVSETAGPVAAAQQPKLVPAAVQPSEQKSERARIEPAPPTQARSLQAAEVQAATVIIPEKGMPASGLARITPPTLPTGSGTGLARQEAGKTSVAMRLQPPAAIVTEAVLAEYRGLPVPAFRMQPCLPGEKGGALSGGRTTPPKELLAAVPVAVAKVRDIKIVYNGQVLSLRAAPELRGDVALAPLREIFEQTDGVLYWFPVEKQVRAVNSAVDLQLKIGRPTLTVNGEQRRLEIAPFIKRGRTMLPLQFIADLLKVSFTINRTTGEILISQNPQ